MKNWLKPLTLALVGGLVSLSACAQTAQQDKERAEAERAREQADASRQQAETAREQAQTLKERVRNEVDAARAARPGTIFWQNRNAKKEKVAYIGIQTTRVDRALRTHLKLPRGIGLVVQSVADKSPASEAGVQESDILQKLDDQWLVTSEQLGILVRMHNPGDEVTLTAIRAGQPQSIKVKLAEKEMVVEDGVGLGGDLTGIYGQLADMQPGEGNMTWVASAPAAELPMRLLELGGADDDADLIYTDNEHTFKITTENNERHLNVTDNKGNQLFDGPIQTDEQKAKLPANLSEKLKKVEEKLQSIPDKKGKAKVRIYSNTSENK